MSDTEHPASVAVSTVNYAAARKAARRLKKELSVDIDAKSIRKNEQANLINKLLSKRVLELKAKKKKLKAKKKRQSTKPPSDKQKAQWSSFANRVSIAKEMYRNQPERSSDAWKRCMREARNVPSQKDIEAALKAMHDTEEVEA